MKVIQINCWSGHLLNPLLKFIRQERPDILCAQEVLSTAKVADGLFRYLQTLEEIKAAGEFKYHFFSPNWGGEVFGQKSEFGNAIFSKLPIEQPRTIFIDSKYQFPVLATEDMTRARNLQICSIAGPRSFVVANHHGLYKPDPIGDEESVESSRMVAAELAKVTEPLVLCGDLNIVKESPAFKPFAELGLRDLAAEHAVTTTLSKVHDIPNKSSVACDYILCSPAINVKSFRVADDIVSDHNALVLEFDY